MASDLAEDALEDALALARECEDALERRDALVARCERSDASASSMTREETDREVERATVEARTRLNGVVARLASVREAMGASTTVEVREAVRALEQRKDAAIKRLASGRRTTAQMTSVTFTGGSPGVSHPVVSPVEDKRATLQIQREMLEEQDDALDHLSRAAGRAKEISIAVGDELDLHAKLLDSLDDEMEDTQGRLSRAARAVQNMMKRGSDCRSASIALLVSALCILLLVLIVKLQR